MLINRSKVKLFALSVAQTRSHKFTRVSKEFCDKCEAHLKTHIHQEIHRHPSVGKTIK